MKRKVTVSVIEHDINNHRESWFSVHKLHQTMGARCSFCLFLIKYARAEKANKISFQQNLLRDPIISPEDPSESPVGHQRRTYICLRLFLLGFSSHSRIFRSYGVVMITITDEGLQFFTYARHLWPMSKGGSLACYTYCETGHPLTMVISEDPRDTHNYCWAVGSGTVTTKVCRGWDSNTQPSACDANALTDWATAVAWRYRITELPRRWSLFLIILNMCSYKKPCPLS